MAAGPAGCRRPSYLTFSCFTSVSPGTSAPYTFLPVRRNELRATLDERRDTPGSGVREPDSGDPIGRLSFAVPRGQGTRLSIGHVHHVVLVDIIFGKVFGKTIR
ncbi:uncharacterized protein METZ01_LOCUS204352, partial [marine metagenome]